jgi:hypothetical protein
MVIVIEGGRQTTPVSRPSLPKPLNQRIATAVGQWHLDFCRARLVNDEMVAVGAVDLRRMAKRAVDQ